MKFKIGDIATINSEPSMWSSLCNEKPPYNIKYPHKFKIKFIRYNKKTECFSMTCGSYGWCLSTLMKEDKIINLSGIRREKLKILDEKW